jgi:hypothetical protein
MIREPACTRPQGSRPLRSLLLALSLSLGCTPATQTGTRAPGEEIRVVNNVVVSFSDAVRELPFDTNAARLKAASEQLAAIAGHRVEYSFDRALLPQYREQFEEMLILSIENTAIDLDRLRGADTFAELVAVLHRIELTYDVAAHEGIGWTSELDIDAKTLRIRLDGDQRAFVPQGLVWHQLAEAEEEILRRAFAGRTVASLRPAEHERYFRYLEDEAPHMGYDEPTTAEALRDHPALPWVVRAMELHERAKDPALRIELADWISDKGGALFYSHLRQAPDAVAKLPPASTYGKTRGAWVRFIHAHGLQLPDATLRKLLDHVFRSDPDRREPNPRALPGLDPLELGLRIADLWIADGHPLDTAEDMGLYRDIVCPVDVAALDRAVVYGCRDDFYRYAWKDAATRERFVTELVARRDEPLVRAATAAIRNFGGPKDVLELWHRTAGDRAVWTMVAKEIALQNPEGLGGELVDEVQALWRREPARRGTLLYVLAQQAREGYRQEKFWPTFAEDFGRVDAKIFVAFLEHGPLAAATVWAIWPALGSFPRGAPFARHIDELLDAPPLDDRRGYLPPVDAIDAVIDRMCQDGRRADLGEVRRALQARMRRKPTDRKELARLELHTGC